MALGALLIKVVWYIFLIISLQYVFSVRTLLCFHVWHAVLGGKLIIATYVCQFHIWQWTGTSLKTRQPSRVMNKPRLHDSASLLSSQLCSHHREQEGKKLTERFCEHLQDITTISKEASNLFLYHEIISTCENLWSLPIFTFLIKRQKAVGISIEQHCPELQTSKGDGEEGKTRRGEFLVSFAIECFSSVFSPASQSPFCACQLKSLEKKT